MSTNIVGVPYRKEPLYRGESISKSGLDVEGNSLFSPTHLEPVVRAKDTTVGKRQEKLFGGRRQCSPAVPHCPVSISPGWRGETSWRGIRAQA